MADYDYFDDDYFNQGHFKGTAYADYINFSRASGVYDEVARAVMGIFNAKRTLEIGCATGLIVRRINEGGVEAHGIDVSQWAIDNREHPNVILTGVEQLPFPDDYFDVIYSVHALEHIPVELKSRAFAEMIRVCSSGVHWHMLPVVGMGPYIGERNAVIAGLKRDPTHNLLEDRAWWLKEFADVGLKDTHAAIYIRSERPPADLSHSQFILARTMLPGGTLDIIREWNFRVMSAHLARADRGGTSLKLTGPWQDLEYDLTGVKVDPGTVLRARIVVNESVALRFAFLNSTNSAEVDYWCMLSAGANDVEFTIGQMNSRSSGSTSDVGFDRALFGGAGHGTVSLNLRLCDAERVIFSA